MMSAMSGKDLLSSADSIQKSAESALGGKFETVIRDQKGYENPEHFFQIFIGGGLRRLCAQIALQGRQIVQGGEERTGGTRVATLISLIRPIDRCLINALFIVFKSNDHFWVRIHRGKGSGKYMKFWDKNFEFLDFP